MGFLLKLRGKNIKELDLYLEIAVDTIIEGKTIAFPTDSVYGIGGDPLNYELIEKIYQIKFRDRTRGLLILVADMEEAAKLAEFNEESKILADKFWPGQLTLILKRKTSCIVPEEVSASKETIGIRIPDNEIVLTILRKLKERGRFGGIIGTSANYSGEKPSVSGDEVAKKFLNPIDLIIDNGKSKSKIPTTIVDCTSQKPNILRLGVISEEDIMKALSIIKL
jgi:L-threonylcarbamoyladenylate synthase